MENWFERSGSRGKVFQNWAKTYSCKPEFYFQPDSTEQIKEVLRNASERGKRVKVVGNGHSPSNIACTDGYMISLSKYNQLLEVDMQKCTVKVQGGMTFSKLNEILKDNGLGVSVLGTVSEISVAGAISTATHGTGAAYGTISSFVIDMDLLTSDCSIIHCSRSEKQDIFLAACCSLGALGIILNVTIQCEPAFKIEQTSYPYKLDSVLENLNVHVSASEHFRFMWYPLTDNICSYHCNRTDKPISRSDSWFWDKFIGFHVLEFALWISVMFPSLVSIINRFHFWLFNSKNAEHKVDWAPNIFNFDCLFKQYVTEWCIDRDKTALVLKELQSWIENNNFPAHFPVEVRFVKGDSFYLSPASGRDCTYINIICYTPYGVSVQHKSYWNAFEKIMYTYGGRPHWAKDHDLTASELERIYPDWRQFCAIREKLDPKGLFLNEYLQKVFDLS